MIKLEYKDYYTEYGTEAFEKDFFLIVPNTDIICIKEALLDFDVAVNDFEIAVQIEKYLFNAIQELKTVIAPILNVKHDIELNCDDICQLPYIQAVDFDTAVANAIISDIDNILEIMSMSENLNKWSDPK